MDKINKSLLTQDNNIFDRYAQQWFLLTAAKTDADGQPHANTMTAAWGGVGVMWAAPVAYIVVRQSRFTKEFVDESKYFTCSWLPEQYREQLTYLGTTSGRDEDKIAHVAAAGLELEWGKSSEYAYFRQSEAALICQKLYQVDLPLSNFTVPGLDEEFYLKMSINNGVRPENDFHTLYIGKIIETIG